MDGTQATSYRLDSPPFHLQSKNTLAECIENSSKVYFFLQEGFRYREEIYRYFDGENTIDATNGEKFLIVLGAVLDETKYVQCSDSFNGQDEDIEGIVRERFLGLYKENYTTLKGIASLVHDKIASLEISEEDPSESIDLRAQVLNFINQDGPREMVAKYYDRTEGKITEDESEEFMRIYEVVKQLCPDSLSDVRKRFNALYFAQEEELIEWGEVFFSPMSSIDSVYQLGGRPPLKESTLTEPLAMSPELVEKRFLTFAELKEHFIGREEYDFAAVGLEPFREQIMGFYDGTLATKEGLFEVLQAVFSCYLSDTPKDSFEGKLRERFEKLFLEECAEKTPILTPSQKEKLWELIKESSCQGSRSEVAPHRPIPYGSEVVSGGSNGGIPLWKKGLAGIGAMILSWVIFKPIFCKLFAFIEERYGTFKIRKNS